MPSTIILRVPPEMREEMTQYDLNWSEEIRNAIAARLARLKREKAYEGMDRIRASLRGRTTGGAKEVRRWRRRR